VFQYVLFDCLLETVKRLENPDLYFIQDDIILVLGAFGVKQTAKGRLETPIYARTSIIIELGSDPDQLANVRRTEIVFAYGGSIPNDRDGET
jgi:hypothetical protein